MHLKQLYISGKENLNNNSVDNPALESYLLLLSTNAISDMAEIYTHPEKEMDAERVDEYFKLLERRANNEPTAYIMGEKEFYSRRFTVNPTVLIPRPETELLAEETIKISKSFDSPRVLDLGTGSGCIAVTIAAEHPGAKVFAADISAEALRTAGDNARMLHTGDKIKFVNADLLGPFKKDAFDIIVSNPPYISESEFEALEPGVREYEPTLSLLGGKDGLKIIRDIVSESPFILKDGGWCLLEIGAGQSERVIELFQSRGFRKIAALRDLSQTKRVIKAQWKK